MAFIPFALAISALAQQTGSKKLWAKWLQTNMQLCAPDKREKQQVPHGLGFVHIYIYLDRDFTYIFSFFIDFCVFKLVFFIDFTGVSHSFLQLIFILTPLV